jgi:hypothetical protein
MGSKNEPGQFDCYENAMPDEPMFILLARDPLAPELVERWAARRSLDIATCIRPIEDRPMVDEARECAEKMREWRKANDGAWRKPR